MQIFRDTFETHKRSFISDFSICMTVFPLNSLHNRSKICRRFLIQHICPNFLLFPGFCKEYLAREEMGPRIFYITVANKYILKVKNRSTRKKYDICYMKSYMKSTNNKDTRMSLMTSLWYLHCYFRAYVTPFSSVSIVNFVQVNVCWS